MAKPVDLNAFIGAVKSLHRSWLTEFRAGRPETENTSAMSIRGLRIPLLSGNASRGLSFARRLESLFHLCFTEVRRSGEGEEKHFLAGYGADVMVH